MQARADTGEELVIACFTSFTTDRRCTYAELGWAGITGVLQILELYMSDQLNGCWTTSSRPISWTTETQTRPSSHFKTRNRSTLMESSSSRSGKLNLKAFTPLPRLGSIDSLELNALKSDREQQSSMDCPKCNERLLCDNCCRYYKGDPVFKAPGCEKCKKRYEKEIDEAKTEVAALRLALKEKFSKQIMAYEDTQKRLSDRLSFLKLQNLDPSNDIFKGDVSLVVNGAELIHAHRFILAGKSPVFCRMFDCSMLEKVTGVIPIDDATFPVMQAVINYCYTADISFSDEVPPEEVLHIAHKYEIVHLRDVCGDELCKRISETNLADMLRLSKKFEAKTLQEAAAKYFKEHFDTVFSTVLENL